MNFEKICLFCVPFYPCNKCFQDHESSGYSRWGVLVWGFFYFYVLVSVILIYMLKHHLFRWNIHWTKKMWIANAHQATNTSTLVSLFVLSLNTVLCSSFICDTYFLLMYEHPKRQNTSISVLLLAHKSHNGKRDLVERKVNQWPIPHQVLFVCCYHDSPQASYEVAILSQFRNKTKLP